MGNEGVRGIVPNNSLTFNVKVVDEDVLNDGEEVCLHETNYIDWELPTNVTVKVMVIVAIGDVVRSNGVAFDIIICHLAGINEPTSITNNVVEHSVRVIINVMVTISEIMDIIRVLVIEMSFEAA